MQNQFQTSNTTEETSLHIAPPAETAETETAQTLPDAQTITDLLTKAQRKLVRRNHRYRSAVGAFVTTVVFMIIVSYSLSFYGVNISYDPFMSLLGAGALLSGAVGIWERLRPTGVNPEELAVLGGKQAIPALMALWRSENLYKDDIMCRSALIACLPRLQATDADLLSYNDRHTLNRVLKQHLLPIDYTEPNLHFALAILRAYEQIGDAQAIPVVERLANIKPRYTHHQKLQQAAQECVPLLRARVSGLEPEQTLLRASTPDTSTPATLLRAAAPAPAAPDDELLRATHRNNNLPLP